MGLYSNLKNYVNRPQNTNNISQQQMQFQQNLNNGYAVPNYDQYQAQAFQQYGNTPVQQDQLIKPRTRDYNQPVNFQQNIGDEVMRYQQQVANNAQHDRYLSSSINNDFQDNSNFYQNYEQVNQQMPNNIFSNVQYSSLQQPQTDFVPNNINNFNPYQNLNIQQQILNNGAIYDSNNMNLQSQDYYQQQNYINNGIYQNQQYSQYANYDQYAANQMNYPMMYNNFNNNYDNINHKNFNRVQQANFKINKARKSSIIPQQIAKEIKSEKYRIVFLLLLGVLAIILGSIFTAAFFTATSKGINNENGYIFGMKFTSIPSPVLMIPIIIVGLTMTIMSLSDYSFIISSVKKYEAQLYAGKEQIPFFITRNYKRMISRAIVINWLAFPTYIIGAIVLGIFYFLQAHEGQDIQFFFWKMAKVGDMTSNITITTIVLVVTLVIHIANIIFSRSRKNNIISYYGYEILPETEIRNIKKRTNRICMIIFFTIMALLLFVFVIIYLIFRKNKRSFRWPWQQPATN